MKILWIVNTPIDVLGEKLYGTRENGAWMDALLSDFRKYGGFELVVATSAKIKKTLRFHNGGVTFYALPDNVPILYNEKKPSNIAAWRSMLYDERPDIIQVWGTEFSHGLCALNIADNMHIPAVIYMQGYLHSIARYYLAGIPYKDIKRTVTIRDFLKHDSILKQQKNFLAATEREFKELSLAGKIICENDWCENSIKAILPDITVYRCPLSINEVFSSYVWDFEKCEKHSVICNASGYPLKGLHILIRAIKLLKSEYPDIKLYVPGEKMLGNESLIWRLRKRGYKKYLDTLIKKLDLSDNIVWLGELSQKQLAEQYSKSNVFVMCSAIENHSSSLKEAMIVGVPSVSSSVGGIPEYVRHGENGFLYRFEEYDIAASYIKKLFEDVPLAKKLSKSAHNDMIKLHGNTDVFNKMFEIYKNIYDERQYQI